MNEKRFPNGAIQPQVSAAAEIKSYDKLPIYVFGGIVGLADGDCNQTEMNSCHYEAKRKGTKCTLTIAKKPERKGIRQESLISLSDAYLIVGEISGLKKIIDNPPLFNLFITKQEFAETYSTILNREGAPVPKLIDIYTDKGTIRLTLTF